MAEILVPFADSQEEPTSDKDVIIAKAISATGLFLISVLCGVIPFKLAKIFKWTEPIDVNNNHNKSKSSKVVTALLCFGAGVLISTTFLHLLPDVSEEVHALQVEGKIPDFGLSIAEVLMMCGFFLIYLIEEIVHYYLHQYQHKLKKAEEDRRATKHEDETIKDAFLRGVSARNSIHRRLSTDNGLPHSNRSSMMITDPHKLNTVLESMEKTNGVDHRHNHHLENHGHSHAIPVPHSEDEDTLVSSLRGLLIVLALTIHELFEGFAVGLEKDAVDVYYLFAAVSAHKYVISFCIGVELIVQKTKMSLAFMYIVMYSIVSAIGIVIGAILTSGSMSESLAVPNVILQGFATGTLLYVIFFEILSKDRSGFIPYASVFAGFLIMTLLQYIAGITESAI